MTLTFIHQISETLYQTTPVREDMTQQDHNTPVLVMLTHPPCLTDEVVTVVEHRDAHLEV